MKRLSLALAMAGLALAALNPVGTFAAQSAGAVFTLSNNPAGNRVLVFERSTDGSLLAVGAVPTGGTGTGAGLGSQGSLTLSSNHHWLYAVNPGSDQISVFRVQGTYLQLTGVSASGGETPISVTAHGNLVYVLNSGGDGNIQGFWRNSSGVLEPIADSNQPLSQAAPAPAQVQFAPNGKRLVVTEKGTNRITFYKIHADGSASAPRFRSSAGPTPFGFDFTRGGKLIVTEAAGGATDASSVSSYKFRGNHVKLLDGVVPTTQTAACWVTITRNGHFAYVTNTGSASVTGYSIAANGDLTLLNSDGVTATTGATPIDDALDGTSSHLYVLNAGADTVTIFDVDSDGSLTAMGSVSTPTGAVGLAAD